MFEILDRLNLVRLLQIVALIMLFSSIVRIVYYIAQPLIAFDFSITTGWLWFQTKSSLEKLVGALYVPMLFLALAELIRIKKGNQK